MEENPNEPDYIKVTVITNNPHGDNQKVIPMHYGHESPRSEADPLQDPEPTIDRKNFLRKLTTKLSAMVKFDDIRMVTDRNDRRNFIRKVYLILSTQMSFTTIFVGIVVGVEKVKSGVQSATTVAIIAAALAFFLVILVFCFVNISRRYPINYIVLALFTIFESYVIAFICSNYSSLAVLSAAFIATGICLSLFLFTYFTRSNITFMKGFIIANLSGGVFFVIFLAVTLHTIVQSVFALIAVVVYSAYLVYDILLISGGRYAQLSYDDYAIASIMLYIDIIGIFLYLLKLFRSNS